MSSLMQQSFESSFYGTGGNAKLSAILYGADRRAEMTFRNAEATSHETQQLQAHLQAQDAAINTLLERFAELENKIAGSYVSTSPFK